MVFLDASALVKRYVREPGSAAVRRLLQISPIAVSRLSAVEVPSAIIRLARDRRLATRARDRALRAFTVDLQAWNVVEFTAEIAARAPELMLRHVLRSGDAIQLASALWLRHSVPLDHLVTFDVRLTAAATAEGFKAVPPRASPSAEAD